MINYLKSVAHDSTNFTDEYDRHRVALGVSEGARDISSGKDFPFEHNLDFLSGVSFSKGCYIGISLFFLTHKFYRNYGSEFTLN